MADDNKLSDKKVDKLYQKKKSETNFLYVKQII
jgi:hypothetical protein